MKLFLLTMFCVSSLAGFKVGNGGHVLKCSDSYELYDYYYAKSFWNGQIQEFREELSYQQILNILIARLNNRFPLLAVHFQKQLEVLNNSLRFLDKVELLPTDDLAVAFSSPKGCLIVQAAVQFDDSYLQKRQYYIDNQIFKKLSPTHRAGLIFHELIYSVLRYKDARNVRLLSFLVVEDFINTRSLYHLRDNLLQLKITEFRYDKLLLNISKEVKFYDDQSIEEAALVPYYFVTIDGVNIFQGKRPARFYKGIEMAKYVSFRSVSGSFFKGTRSFSPHGEWHFGSIKLFKNGKIKQLYKSYNPATSIINSGANIKTARCESNWHFLWFSEDNRLLKCKGR